MSKYTSRFIAFSKELMEKQGEDVKRWSHDPNPVIASAFQECIEAGREAQG